MAIPDYQDIMLPLLRRASDGSQHRIRDAIEDLAGEFRLTEEERKQLLPSGQAKLFNDRLGWAATYLRKAGLIESPSRGIYRITGRGKDVLSQQISALTTDTLKQFPEFLEFVNSKKRIAEAAAAGAVPDQTPEELIESGYQRIRENLEAEILRQVKDSTPEFFERLVVNLLVKMGYGGSLYDAGTAIGRSGDGGIDGIIKEDKLGLDAVYVQAKKWENGLVGRPEVQKFAGALQGQRARKGVFITTSGFTKDAHDYVSRIDSRIVLVDGNELARLMVDNDVGVSTVSTYYVKKVDSDYFAED